MRYILETRNLTKSYGNKIVINGINLKIKPGEIFALLGLNGAGKTTTIKMLLGLINPSMGQIRYMDKNFQTTKSDILPMIGCVLERPGVYSNLSVVENLELIQNVIGTHQDDNIDEVLKITGMDAFKYEKVKHLSSAHIQKLALCRALLNSPEILILDEPMNGLDPKSVNEIRTLLIRLSKEKNVTILISSHVLSEVEQLADRIGILQYGRLTEIVNKKDIYKKTKDRFLLNVEDNDHAKQILRQAGYYCLESRSGELVLRITENHIHDVLKILVEHDVAVNEAYFKSMDLEDVFLDIVRSR